MPTNRPPLATVVLLAFSLCLISPLSGQHSVFVPLERASDEQTVQTFDEPIDGLSVRIDDPQQALEVQAFDGALWTDWQPLALENEQDPLLTESNLVLFPTAVKRIRFRGEIAADAVHPIRVSHAPKSYRLAATSVLGTPKILSRSDWGADESLRLKNGSTNGNSSEDDIASDVSAADVSKLTTRQRECLEAQEKYPNDFKRTGKTVTTYNNSPLRWPQEYSPKIKLLTVHHTAVKANGETRNGVERMRALYQYHAENRGWGDIGYHYVIDDEGQIYEGRAGGDFVVAGHAYCNNLGTIGISLMGNFEVEEPTQEQMKSLQELLHDLADKYDIDLNKNVTYHGKSFAPIVGHRDLVSTDCPGYYAYEVLDQVRMNVAKGDMNKLIRFPEGKGIFARKQDKARPNLAVSTKGTFFYQEADLTGRPGSDILFPVRFLASKPLKQRTGIADIVRSDPAMLVYLVTPDSAMRLRDQLLLPQFVRQGDTVTLYLRVRLPTKPGTYDLRIGNLEYALKAEGRRVRTLTDVGERRLLRSLQATIPVTNGAVPLDQTPSTPSAPTTSSSKAYDNGPMVRILLSYASNDPAHPDRAFIDAPVGSSLNGKQISGTVVFEKVGDVCRASNELGPITDALPRLHPHGKILAITSWNTFYNRFRGTIECRIIDGRLQLINELPMEDYLRGLAEEPDSEPYEKQRAFAIAARTYATWYLDPKYRKFPGKPYDGSDSPAVFQKYSGAAWEDRNPNWLKALESTKHLVLKVNGQLIKPPYFSSDDGRTLSPAEAGWKNFPFADVFASKPDPWCEGMENRGHRVGMSGCGAEAQAKEGKTGEEILKYYYTGVTITR